MPESPHDTDPVDENVEETGAPELDGQSTTVEEAMDAATDEEGFAHESAYTTPAGSTVVSDPASDEDAPSSREDNDSASA